MSTKKLQLIGDSLSIEVTDEQVSTAVNEYLTENPVESVKGEDGVSPTVAVTTITGGHRVTITDASGTRYFDVMNGKDGTDAVGIPGTNGVSPTISVSAIDGGHEVTITDVNGTKIFNVMDGSGIDDAQVSSTTTYSSSKIDALLNEQNEAKVNQAGWTAGKNVVIGDDGKMTTEDKPTIPTVPESLKNPFPLTINGQSYDGSEEVNVTVEGGYTLPVASPDTLGGVKPAAKTDEMTQEVGVDADGKLWGIPGGSTEFERIIDVTLEEDVAEIVIPQTDEIKNAFNAANEISITLHVVKANTTTATTDGPITICQRFSWGDGREIVSALANMVPHTGNMSWKKDNDLLLTGQRAVGDNGFAGTFHKNTVFVCNYVYAGNKTGIFFAHGLDAVSLVVKTTNDNLFGAGTKFIVAVR